MIPQNGFIPSSLLRFGTHFEVKKYPAACCGWDFLFLKMGSYPAARCESKLFEVKKYPAARCGWDFLLIICVLRCIKDFDYFLWIFKVLKTNASAGIRTQINALPHSAWKAIVLAVGPP